MDGISAIVFKVAGSGADAADPLGLWQRPASAGVESFAAGPGGAETLTLWQADWPADSRQAQQTLAARKARLDQAERALPDAARRLQRFIALGPDDAVSFSAGPRAQPERELAAWVDLASAEVSFGLGDRLPGDWKEVAAQAMEFFSSVRDALFSVALVESSRDGHRFGLTAISLTGNLRTAWGSEADAAEAEQHAGSVALALRSRTLWVRMALLVLRSAVQLGVLFPTNPVLALPAAYRFFRKALELAREMEPQPVV